MSYKLNDDLANAALNAIGTELADGFLHLFAGPVPADPDAALDMMNDHTLVCTITKDGDGTTGLTFGTAAASALPKNPAETWAGTAAFDGADDGETELTLTFFRYCAAGDNGQGAGSTSPRLQGTIGATGSGADMERASAVVEAAEVISIDAFYIRVGTLV